LHLVDKYSNKLDTHVKANLSDLQQPAAHCVKAEHAVFRYRLYLNTVCLRMLHCGTEQDRHSGPSGLSVTVATWKVNSSLCLRHRL